MNVSSISKGLLLAALIPLVACQAGVGADGSTITRFDANDPDVDRGLDAHRLSDMRASIWVDPLGCQHWLIDDGVEGYLSNRLNLDGTPRCDGPDVRAGEEVGSTQRLIRNPN